MEYVKPIQPASKKLQPKPQPRAAPTGEDEADRDMECAVCLSRPPRPCRVLCCSQLFCADCISHALSLGDGFGCCPLCRQYVGLVSTIDVASGKALIPSAPRPRLAGSIWVQAQTLGFASFHIEGEGSSYVSYESPRCQLFPRMDDGFGPPPFKRFRDVRLDEEALTFEGTIDWLPNSWGGEVKWVYSMCFSPDRATIMRGNVKAFGREGDLRRTVEFGRSLRYVNAELVANPRVQPQRAADAPSAGESRPSSGEAPRSDRDDEEGLFGAIGALVRWAQNLRV